MKKDSLFLKLSFLPESGKNQDEIKELQLAAATATRCR
jgi:hypothetical protein